MHTQTPRADVCTTIPAAGEADPRLPYPEHLTIGPTGDPVRYWTVVVQRGEAQLAALEAHQIQMWAAPASDALCDALALASFLLRDDVAAKRRLLAISQAAANQTAAGVPA